MNAKRYAFPETDAKASPEGVELPRKEHGAATCRTTGNILKKAVALEGRLRRCRNVVTLGVRPNFSDYTEAEKALILDADPLYYPTRLYADLFDVLGKRTFPSYHTYKCVQDKIRQSALLCLLKIPHPKTRVFYGKRQKGSILSHFRFPLIAKIPRNAAMGRGVFLIRNAEALEAYCARSHPAYIQEYLPIDRDIRVVVIGNRVVHAYWRVAPENEFRTNVACGAQIRFDPIPPAALDLALYAARRCRWDDVGIDICMVDGKGYVLEANMKYGREGFRLAGIDLDRLMESWIENREI